MLHKCSCCDAGVGTGRTVMGPGRDLQEQKRKVQVVAVPRRVDVGRCCG